MPDDLTPAGILLGGKQTVASEMRTAEWAMTGQWLRERSYFMAGVTRAEILDKFREEAAAMVEGQSSDAESLREIEDYLDEIGYKAEPGEEGTIKDLRTARRILVSLRTNVSLVRGWARKERGMREISLRISPAWELVRFESREKERDWQARWEKVGGVLINGRMIALKTDDIWRRLGHAFADSLMVDYPPFAWQSGMNWEEVGRRECIALGLIAADAPDQVAMPVSSPNEGVVLKPKIKSEEVRDALADEMKGLAKWEDEKLIFTDPNGTRPYPAEELSEIWEAPMPEPFEKLPGGGQMQRAAFEIWADDHDDYLQDDFGKSPGAGLNAMEDLRRAFSRIEPMTGEVPLYRGLSFLRGKGGEAFESLGAFLEDLEESGIYYPNPFRPAESWTASAAEALAYAGGEFFVRLIVNGHKTARDISPLLLKAGTGENSTAVFLRGVKFRVVKIVKVGSKGAEITLEEMP